VREEDKGKIWRRPSPLRAIVCVVKHTDLILEGKEKEES
jgi:hypothetical protein